MTRLPPSVAALTAMVMLAAACGGEKTSPTTATAPVAPTEAAPPVISVQPRLDDTASAYVAAAASSAAERLGVRVAVGGEASAAPAGPSVIIESRKPEHGEGLAVPVRFWGAFASFWNETEGLSFEGVRQAATGGAADWADLGAAAGPLTTYLPLELRASLETLLGPLPPDDAATVRWLPLSEVVDAAAADAGSLLLLPVARADPRLRSLAVDGVDAVRGVGDPLTSPFVERLWLTWEGEEARPLAAELAKALEAAPPSPVRVVATGDIIPARCVYDRQRAAGDYRQAFRPTADYLRAADLTLGSLDASLSDAGEPFGCTRTLSLLAPARSVEGLVYAGLDVVTVATNHAKDCGTNPCGDQAFLDTLANLRAAGIEPVGGGVDLAEARRPAVVTAGGVSFAVLGYDDIAASVYGATETSPGTAPLDGDTLAEDVAAALDRADVVIVMPHWGSEYTALPSERQQELARQAIAAGATLVVGNHAHVVQAVEWSDGGFVAYGLGNFIFDQDWSLETQQGVVLEATFQGPRLVGVRLHPVHIHDMHQPRWADTDEARSILQRVQDASQVVVPFP